MTVFLVRLCDDRSRKHKKLIAGISNVIDSVKEKWQQSILDTDYLRTTKKRLETLEFLA